MKRYIKWLDKKKLLAKDVKYEMLETIEKATKDLPRVKKAASLLYKLCDKNNEKFSVDDFEDENFMEGYGEVIEIFEDKLYLDYNGEKIGPVKITKKIAKYLKIGDTVNLAMGRKGDIWYPLESGFVYPRPLSEFGF